MIHFSQSISRAGPRLGVRRGLLTLCAAGVLLALAACASGPDKRFAEDRHAQAKAAYLAHDYQRTLAIVEPQAAAGAAWAQYTLGFMYYYGRGVRIDRQLARQWIQQAAAQDYPPAKEAVRRLPPVDVPADPVSAAPPAKSGDTAPPGLAASPAAPAPNFPPREMPAGQEAAAQGGGANMETSPPASMPAVPAPPPAEPVAAVPPMEASPAPMSEPPAEPVVAAAEPATVEPAEPGPPAVSSDPVTRASPAIPLAAAADERDNRWVSQQDPARLTLQLIGSSDRAAITRYLREHALEKEGAYYITSRAGRPWYVVVYGNYADLNEARAALGRLSPALRGASPWIRPFADIQQQINTTVP